MSLPRGSHGGQELDIHDLPCSKTQGEWVIQLGLSRINGLEEGLVLAASGEVQV